MSKVSHQAASSWPARPKCPKWQTASQVGAGDSERPRTRIFISYKRNIIPDEDIAKQLFDTLLQEHDVFIDKTMLVGTDWAECIETKLQESDFLISILSLQSVNSEMVKGEIEKAHYYGKQNGHPAILPVRLAYRDPFPYSLSSLLNSLQWAYWDCENDTPRLIEELRRAISGDQLSSSGVPTGGTTVPISIGGIPQPLPAASLELPEGTMDPQSRFYIERKIDKVALEAIKLKGVTIPIKAPRQMGKSSLLLRVIEAAKKEGKQAVMLDFQLFDQEALTTADTFYRQFCAVLSSKLGKENKVEEYWDPNLGNNQRCTSYFEQYLLREVDGHLILAMDEVERIFDTEFRSDFFSMLRSWHNSRADNESIWKNLDLVLVTSTEPYQLIENLNQSPFNVGQVIELTDFTSDELHKLNTLHGGPLTETDEQRLQEMLNGHPYLVRRALYLVATERISIKDLFAQAADERGPFGDHLRYHLFRMYKKEELVKGMREIIRHHTCSDESIFFRLRGAGLIRRGNGFVSPRFRLFFWRKSRKKLTVLPRCQLYENYFREHLNA